MKDVIRSGLAVGIGGALVLGGIALPQHGDPLPGATAIPRARGQ